MIETIKQILVRAFTTPYLEMTTLDSLVVGAVGLILFLTGYGILRAYKRLIKRWERQEEEHGTP